MGTMNLADPELELLDPTPNIHSLFVHFDKTFFYTKLNSRAVVRWSKRMYSCAGTCSYEGRGGLCDIALSEPLLKLRPRKDLVETLLHEMIHAFLFVTNHDQDRDGHGPNFRSHMNRINKSAGLNIGVYHDFHDEVKLYLTHWWRCEGPCQRKSPYFGIVRRSSNRAPGPSDYWWKDHKRKCGGVFVKIKAPPQKAIGSRRINTNIPELPKRHTNNNDITLDGSNFTFENHPGACQIKDNVPNNNTRQTPTNLPENDEIIEDWPTNQIPAGQPENNQFINNSPTNQIPAVLLANNQFINTWPTHLIPAGLPAMNQFFNNWPNNQISARLPANFQIRNYWPINQMPPRLLANNQVTTNRLHTQMPASVSTNNPRYFWPSNQIPADISVNNIVRHFWADDQFPALLPVNNAAANIFITNHWPTNQIPAGLPPNDLETIIWSTNQIPASLPTNNPIRNALPTNQTPASLPINNPIRNALPTNQTPANLPEDNIIQNISVPNQILAGVSPNEVVRNIWANKRIPPLQAPVSDTVNNTTNRNNNDNVPSPPAKMTRIDDYFKANATLRNLYGEEYSLPQPQRSNTEDTGDNAHEQEIIECPVCNAEILHINVNRHLDECLNRDVIENLTRNHDQPSQHSTNNNRNGEIDGHLTLNTNEAIDLTTNVNTRESVAILETDSNIDNLVNNYRNSERLDIDSELPTIDEQVINIENTSATTKDQRKNIHKTSKKRKLQKDRFVTKHRGDDIIEVEFTESQRKSRQKKTKRNIVLISEPSTSKSPTFYFEDAPATNPSEVTPETSQSNAVPGTSQSSVTPELRMSTNDELEIQKCPCCGNKFDKPVEDHLDECLAFIIDDTWTNEEPSASCSNNDVVVIDDDEFDESQTLNSTGTKTPCPCCMRMVEETAMEPHLDFCLGKWFQ